MISRIPKWSSEEALNFENAKDTITDLMSIITSEINKESDVIKVRALRKQRFSLSMERASLRLQNHEHVAKVNQKYAETVQTSFESLRLGKEPIPESS